MKTTFTTFALILLLRVSASSAQELTVVQPLSEASVVYNWSTQRCDARDVPDAPMRAARLADGTVMALDSSWDTRRFVGPDLDSLKHDCAIVYRSQHNADPSQFADRTWIASLWTDDGNTIYGLSHNEYHGELHADHCKFHTLEQCWYADIGLVRSIDRGKSYERVSVEPIAAAPVREEDSQGQRRGFANPTNLIRKDGYFYTIIRASRFGDQRFGNCLFRAKQIDDLSSWTLFDGKQFIPAATDPYRTPSGNSTPCAILPLPGALASVVQYKETGLYLATAELRDPATRSGQVIVSTSRDLMKWSAPVTVLTMPLANSFQCSDLYTYAYPTLMDPASSSRNFETVSDHPFLYMTRIRMAHCGLTVNRDLIRLSVRISE